MQYRHAWVGFQRPFQGRQGKASHYRGDHVSLDETIPVGLRYGRNADKNSTPVGAGLVATNDLVYIAG